MNKKLSRHILLRKYVVRHARLIEQLCVLRNSKKKRTYKETFVVMASVGTIGFASLGWSLLISVVLTVVIWFTFWGINQSKVGKNIDSLTNQIDTGSRRSDTVPI